jgi:fumarylacetoacetase
MKSWIESANTGETDFPLQNLPCGVFSTDDDLRCGVAIGDMILDVTGLEADGRLDLPEDLLFVTGAWNDFMDLGPEIWAAFRAMLTGWLAAGAGAESWLAPYLVPMADVRMHMPIQVMGYTDFYAGRHHAFNVGSMFRGPENALPPNWLSIPIGYNGRASSVIVSGTPVRRPWGQLKSADHELPAFLPSRRFDFELELGAVVGQPSEGMVSVAQADEMIFGYVLLNDWSARDIQAWEYQPLGPFQAKATATTISPWIVPKVALAPFRVSAPPRERPLLPYLQDPGLMLYDLRLEARLAPDGQSPTVITRTNARELYYSAAQQLAHHTTSGCPMEVGDLLGSGTISGPERGNRGSLLELSWGGKDPLMLDTGDTRTFLEDGDTLTLTGYAQGEGYRIGFGTCSGTILPAHTDPVGAGR